MPYMLWCKKIKGNNAFGWEGAPPWCVVISQSVSGMLTIKRSSCNFLILLDSIWNILWQSEKCCRLHNSQNKKKKWPKNGDNSKQVLFNYTHNINDWSFEFPNQKGVYTVYLLIFSVKYWCNICMAAEMDKKGVLLLRFTFPSHCEVTYSLNSLTWGQNAKEERSG